MPFDGSISCWIPDIPYPRDDEWRLKIAQFGDGYQQRILDGINALNQKWSLTWVNRERSILNAMVNYLVAQKANAFQFWDRETGLTHQVFCDSWHVDLTFRGAAKSNGTPARYFGTLTAEFVKANGITG